MAEAKKAEELSANQKIALVLAAMGADNASAVYKHLSDDEIEALSTEVAKLEYQPIDVVEGVLNEFYELCLTQKVVTEGGVDYAREILEKAFGTEAANNLLQRITKQLKTKSFDFVRKADYKNLLAIVQNEHPQTIALILSYARIDQAAAILAELPKEKRVEVVERIARMDRASPDVIKALEATLEKKFANLVNTDSMEVGGISYVAEVMNNVDRATEKYIFDELSARDQKLADQIKQKMFVFEDIVNLDSMAIQEFTKQVDPNMVIKKKDDKEEEVQNGWVGHVIPFDLVQTTLLREDYDALKAKEARLDEIAAELTEIIDSIDEGDRGEFLNDDNTAFVPKEFAAKLAEIYADISSPELLGLQGYAALIDAKAGKAAKLQYIFEHKEVNWAFVDGNAPYTKGKVAVYMKTLREAYSFPEDSFEAKMVCADKLMTEEKAVKKDVKEKSYALHMKTKETIEGLSDEQILDLLRLKWIVPLCASLRAMPDAIIDTLEKAAQALADKYAVTYLELDEQIQKSEEALSSMIDELTGNEYDMKGLAEFKALLQGDANE